MAYKKIMDVRLLANCPVCGSKKGARCVEISTARLRGKAGHGSLSAFRKTLAPREPHDSRLLRSDLIARAHMAIALIATEIGAEPPKAKRKKRARAA